MSLFGSLTATVSGLNAQSDSISVISDNLSNVNTVGYKSSRTLFDQLVTTSGGAGNFNPGGVGSSVLRQQSLQGSLINTQSATDLAISGDGYFIVTSNNANDSTTETFYTRAGAFSEDAEGYLVTPQGNYLNGWETDSAGTILDTQNIQAIELSSASSSARASTQLELGANLNSSTAFYGYDTTSALSNDIAALVANPSANAGYITDARLFDSLGNARDVSIAFSRRSTNFWDYAVYTDGANVSGGTAETNTLLNNGTIRFDGAGSLLDVTNNTFTADWADGAFDATVTLDFGDEIAGRVATGAAGLLYTNHVLDIAVDDAAFTPGTYTFHTDAADPNIIELQDAANNVLGTATLSASSEVREIEFFNGANSLGIRMRVGANFTVPAVNTDIGDFTVAEKVATGSGSGTNGIIQLGSANNTSFVNQDGFGAGTLNNISVNDEGFLIGSFTNGETKRLWKLSMAVFQNPAALETVSGSLLSETDASGAPLIKEAGVGGTGEIASGSLEQSTVDIAGEFTNMITAQRAYQASSTVISTVDAMLNELLNIR